jgi:hypothetical protein
MKRVLLAFGILIVLAVGLGPWAYRTFWVSGDPIVLAPFDYRTNDSWAALPAESPAPVWKDGWAVDVILVAPGAGLAPRSESERASQAARSREQAGRLADSFSSVGPVYAPLYRKASEQTDLSAAIQQYVAKHNRGRAFVIATDHPLPVESLASIKDDASLRARFGGFLRLARDGSDNPFPAIAGNAGAAAQLQAYCPDQYSEAAACQPVVQIGRQDGTLIVAQDTPIGGNNLAQLTAWLEANVAKTAEPLGSLEEIEIIDIRRPGDTDAKRAIEAQ